MASADFLQFVVTMFRFEYVYSYAPARPPRVSVTTFTSYICCIYALKFGQYWTSFCLGNSSVSNTPYIQFLFVRPRLCRGLPSDSTSRWTPLPLANSSYCQVCSGLSPPSDSACRAHQKNGSSQTPSTDEFMRSHIGFSTYFFAVNDSAEVAPPEPSYRASFSPCSAEALLVTRPDGLAGRGTA